jgi:hypothetical protein
MIRTVRMAMKISMGYDYPGEKQFLKETCAIAINSADFDYMKPKRGFYTNSGVTYGHR